MVKFITKCLLFLFALHFSASAQTTSRVVCDENCKTDIGGVFVAGDVRTKILRQVVTAVSDGAVAASMAEEYITEKF